MLSSGQQARLDFPPMLPRLVDLSLATSNVQLDQGALNILVPHYPLLSEEPHTPELLGGVLAHGYNLLPLPTSPS